LAEENTPMAEIRKLGWAGVWFALAIFAAGFLTGGVFHHVTMPVALSAPPQVEAPALTPSIPSPLPPPIPVAEITRLAQEVSGMRAQLTEMNATLLRIEAAMAKR
jgi:hypothetical protein